MNWSVAVCFAPPRFVLSEPLRWCPTILPRRRPFSSGGPNSHTPRNQRNSQNTTSVGLLPSPLHRLTPPQRPPPSTIPSLVNHSRTPSDVPAYKYRPQMPTATSTYGVTSQSSLQSGPSLSLLPPASLTPRQRPLSQGKRYISVLVPLTTTHPPQLPRSQAPFV